MALTRVEPAPAQARSERTRLLILEAALRRMAEGGPAAVTHRAVAEEAGVSLGATTYHFASKDDLIEAAYRLHLDRVRERAEALAGGALPDARGAEPGEIAGGLLRYLEIGVRRDRSASLATFELALARARDPALRRRLARWKRESDAYASRTLEALGAEDAERDAALLICALNGLRLEWLIEGEQSAFGRRVPQLVERLAELVFARR